VKLTGRTRVGYYVLSVATGALAGMCAARGQWLFAAAFAVWAVTLHSMVRLVTIHYWQGWMEGRLAMLASMKEAQQRGMTPQQWLMGEFERDGINVHITLKGESDEDPR